MWKKIPAVSIFCLFYIHDLRSVLSLFSNRQTRRHTNYTLSILCEFVISNYHKLYLHIYIFPIEYLWLFIGIYLSERAVEVLGTSWPPGSATLRVVATVYIGRWNTQICRHNVKLLMNMCICMLIFCIYLANDFVIFYIICILKDY